MKPRFRNLILPATTFLSFLPLASLQAADYTWTGATSNVSTLNTNWSPTGVPGVADNVTINDSSINPMNVPSGNWSRQGAGSTTISGTGIVNVNTGSARLQSWGPFNVTGGQLNQNGEYFILGAAGIGTVIQSGGAITSSHSRGFFLSDGNGLGTSYTMSGGTLTVNTLATYNAGNTEDRRLRSVWIGKGTEGTVDPNVAGDVFKITAGTALFTRTHASSTADLLLSRNGILRVEGGTATFDKYNEVRIGQGSTNTTGLTPSGALNTKISVSGGILNITGNSNVRVGFADAGTIEMTGGELNITGNMNVGTGSSKGTVNMTGGSLVVTNTGTDVIGGANNGNGTVSLSGTSVLNAATTKWKTGDFGGTGNAGTVSISLSDSAALTLKEFTIGHLGSSSATGTVTLSGNSTLTVNNFITIGRDDNATQSGINNFLNLNGGTLATKYIVKGSDNSNELKNLIQANGGTIKALADEADFIRQGTFNPGRLYTTIGAGGLTFDTNGFNVGIQSVLAGTGGLTKIGSGTLTLSGYNSFTGTTSVLDGTLQALTNGALAGACSVADGATLLVNGDPYGTWTTPDLLLADGSKVSVMNVDSLDYMGPAVTTTNSLVPTGTVSIGLPGTLRVGDFPLIGYPAGGSIGGDGIEAFEIDSLPRGVVASLIDSNNAVTLHVEAINALLWKGNVNSNWDINSTANWTLSGSPNTYLENDNVLFNDSATSKNVLLNANVTPANVTFDSSANYTLAGTGGITGSTALTKNGTGTLTVTTPNTYTGVTSVNDGGTLQIGNGTVDSSINGALEINEASVIFNTATQSTVAGNIDGFAISGLLTKTGPGKLVLAGGANSYVGNFAITQGTAEYGNGVSGLVGASTSHAVSSGATLRLNQPVASIVPWGGLSGSGLVSLNSAQAVNGSAAWGRAQILPAFTGVVRIEKGRVDTNGGSGDLGGTSRIEVLSGGQFLCFTSASPYTTPIEIAGTGWGESGFPGCLRLAANATTTWAGPVKLTADSGIIAQRGSSFTISGSITGNFVCEFYAGDANGDSGTLTVAPASGQNSYGGTRVNGRASASVVAGNANAFSSGPMEVVNAILKLNGNSFTFASLSGTGGVIGNYGTTNSVLTAGNGTNTTYAGIMRDGDTGKLALVKTGTGTLTLTGANTYSGDTTVSAGKLSINTPYLADTSTVTVATGAQLDLATGTALDTVGKLILGGVTVPGGTYNSTHPTYGSYFTGTGSVVVAGGYSSWATNAGLTELNNATTADPDGDGVSNLFEFYLNGNPLSTNSSVLPASTLDATYVTLSFKRRDEAEADVSTQVVQYGNALTGWTDVVLGATSAAADANGVIVTVTENAEAADDITVQIPRALAASGKLFARLKLVR